MTKYAISASLLAANFASLGQDAKAVLEAGAERIHVDVMDNHFVPNLTVGPQVCSALRDYGIKAPIDAHLMIKNVDSLIPQFIKAQVSTILIHPEAELHIDRSLQLIRDGGVEAGIALNPATTLESLEYILEKISVVLVMTVNPGFGGQSFIKSQLKKITALRKLLDKSGLPIRLEVDGGVKLDNIKIIKEAGADTFVVGSGLFANSNYQKTLAQFKTIFSS